MTKKESWKALCEKSEKNIYYFVTVSEAHSMGYDAGHEALDKEVAKLKGILKHARDELASLNLPPWLRPKYFITRIDEVLADKS